MRKYSALVLVALFITTSVYARPSLVKKGGQPAVKSQTFTQDFPSEDCGTIDPNKPCYMGNGDYMQCSAKGSLDQMCQILSADPLNKAIRYCSSVRRSASCQCDDKVLKASGSCQYYR